MIENKNPNPQVLPAVGKQFSIQAPGFSDEQKLRDAIECLDTLIGMNLNMEAEAVETRHYEQAATCRTRAQTYEAILRLLT